MKLAESDRSLIFYISAFNLKKNLIIFIPLFLWARNLASHSEEIKQTDAFENVFLRGIFELDTCPKLFSGRPGFKPLLEYTVT
jgi:hypothetical protein